MASTSRPVAPFLLAAFTLVSATFAQGKQPESALGKSYDAALARYKECIVRLPLVHHTEGRQKLAETRKQEALQILVEDYAKTKNFPEYARYTLATLFGRNFSNAESVPVFDALRKANSKPVDMWLWVNTLRIQADKQDDSELQNIIASDKNAMHRAAAILALGHSRNGNLKQALVTTCVDFPKKESERNILIGAMSGAIFENKGRVNDEDFREGLKAYISLLAPELGLSHTIKLQMARHLQWILKGPALFEDPQSWLDLLQRGDVKKTTDNRTTAQQRFFGIETDGERFCYVVDMSDSMCKDISPSSRPTGPLTGPKQKKPKGVLPDESDLPWAKIKTRWDLAREQLRISLQRLPADKYFSIVWFGTESGTLEATKGMMKATKGNIDRALAELDSIQTGKADPVKSPDGELRGSTNMHSGLRRAFGLHDKGFVDTLAYVDPDALTKGCDTIFLLSDGEPSSDDFTVEDRDYEEGTQVVDVEYAAAAARMPRSNYIGPYAMPDWLLEDFQRMNAFRRIRLHCIGLGEANMSLLDRLAELGHGEVYVVGKQNDAERKVGK
ncbi:MAG: hypothetical protein IT456_14555 [Planctomycetes bacterium]|nr:hypothetical protein [Planctomycetota bacterium]